MGKQSKRTSKVASVLIGVSGLVVLSTTAVVKPVHRGESFEGPELGAAEMLAFQTNADHRLQSPVIAASVLPTIEAVQLEDLTVGEESTGELLEAEPLQVVRD